MEAKEKLLELKKKFSETMLENPDFRILALDLFGSKTEVKDLLCEPRFSEEGKTTHFQVRIGHNETTGSNLGG